MNNLRVIHDHSLIMNDCKSGNRLMLHINFNAGTSFMNNLGVIHDQSFIIMIAKVLID